jgi:hypothetical protein
MTPSGIEPATFLLAALCPLTNCAIACPFYKGLTSINFQCLRFALSERPNRVEVSITWGRKQIQFPKHCFLILRCRTMNDFVNMYTLYLNVSICKYWLPTMDFKDKHWHTTDPTSRHRGRPNKRQNRNFKKKKKISGQMSHIWARHQDILTDWPSVAMWLWLWLWLW